ncbi:MAG TPA: hypothetical protein VMM78_17770 [Thermomicrobiales bacterium]|nr:hypothetical protein [Thermomicrobiales bacterium]
MWALSTVTVEALDLDDENEEKFWSHGIMPRQVDAVLNRPFSVLPNRKNRRAPYILIGVDSSGRCIAIPIEPTHDPVIWRPITAWYCKGSEYALLPRTR